MRKLSKSIEDQQLWENFLAGDKNCGTEFFKKWFKELLYYSISFVKDKQAAEDIVQETFEILLKKVESGGEITDVVALLKVITRWKSINYYRKQGRIIEGNKVYLSGISMDSEIKESLTEEVIVNVMKEKLSDYEYSVIEYYIMGFKIPEIARIMKKENKNISDAIHSCRKKLKSLAHYFFNL